MPPIRVKRTSLEGLAKALGVTVADFYVRPSSEGIILTADLLRLWTAIPNQAGRDRVLELMREITGASAAVEKVAAE